MSIYQAIHNRLMHIMWMQTYASNFVDEGGGSSMMRMIPFTLENGETVLGVEVNLPKTNLLAITTDKGYIMCGALDVALLNERLKSREIIAGRAVGVRTLEELMEAPLESVTFTAEKLGIVAGMKGSDALRLML